jgi:glycosyltransferase involved in cell wall biosynthesis
VIDVVLPALDEAAALPGLLARFPPGFAPLVVDNGSVDGTAEVARACGARVVHEPIPGFGSACFTGLMATTTDLVAFMDADGSLDPADLPRLSAPLLRGEADLVLGRRRSERGAWPAHARAANAVLSAVLAVRVGLRLRDLGPMRIVRRADLLGLQLADRRSGWPLEMVLKAHRAGLRIDEVDVGYSPRVGSSKVTGTVRGTLTAVVDMGRLLR